MVRQKNRPHLISWWIGLALIGIPIASQAQSPPAKIQIVLLGTGTPNADPERSGPALAIVANDVPYLVDCGTGLVRRAAAAKLSGIQGLEMSRLTHLFITHLHSDHTLGYADLILSPWVLGRKEPLEAFGPKGLQAMTRELLRAYHKDIQIRLHGGEPSNPGGYQVQVHEIRPGVIYHDSNLVVKAFSVSHGAWPVAFGFRFETAGGSIVISGDTIPSRNVVENCRGCNILVHEVYSQAGFSKRPPAWQKYHAQYHTSSVELAQLATEARPDLLILYHQLFWGNTEEELLAEIRQGYSGRVVSGRDLDVYQLPQTP